MFLIPVCSGRNESHVRHFSYAWKEREAFHFDLQLSQSRSVTSDGSPETGVGGNRKMLTVICDDDELATVRREPDRAGFAHRPTSLPRSVLPKPTVPTRDRAYSARWCGPVGLDVERSSVGIRGSFPVGAAFWLAVW